MKRRGLERHLREHGCRQIGEGANHAKWRGPAGAPSAVPRHNEIATGTPRAHAAPVMSSTDGNS